MSENIRINARALGLIGLLGGLGGAINALLLDSRIPVEVHKTSFRVDELYYSLHVLTLAGFLHGALLAGTSVALSILWWNQKGISRWLLIPVAGWLSGYFSTISLVLAYCKLQIPCLIPGAVWPLLFLLNLKDFGIWPPFWVPFWLFGSVGLTYYFFLNLCRLLTTRHLLSHVLIGCFSGVIGSLWTWSSGFPYMTGQDFSFHLEAAIPERFSGALVSLIHGTIWGSLVGFGVWKSQQAVQRLQSDV